MKIRTPESREAEAKKILEARAQRPAANAANPKQRGPLPVPLSPEERVKASKPAPRKFIAASEPKAD